MDAVEHDLAVYLKAGERAEALDAAVEDKAKQLLSRSGSHYPFTEENIREALGEISADLTISLKDFAESLAHNGALQAGTMIGILIYAYWGKQADSSAEHEISTDCQKCFGRGCRKCDPPEPDYDD